MMRRISCVMATLMVLVLCTTVGAADRLRLATTTSTENTGLLYVLIPPFEKAQGVKVHVIAVGTGKALKLGKRCDVDVVMVHAPAVEQKYVADGFGVDRRKLMHNFFVVVGPKSDPAKVAGAGSAAEAFRRIAAAKAVFVSRGDNSGTNIKELAIWKSAGIKPNWPGYKEAGQGMGAVLTMAGQMAAYTMTDSGTYLKYKSAGKLALEILLTQVPKLKNPYHVMMVNPARCSGVKAELAKAFIDYLVSPQAQKIIKEYQASGQQLFWPDAMGAN